MIAREEDRVLPEQHGVAARVAGSRDGDEIVREADGVIAFESAFGRLAERRGVPGMDDAVAAEALPERGVVGDVVAVREKQRRDAAEALEAREQRGRGARRVHEDVPLRARREPAPGAERLLRRVAAEVDAVPVVLRKSVRGLPCFRGAVCGADRACRAGDERLQRTRFRRRAARLVRYVRKAAALREDLRRHLPARRAVDARAVDVEIPGRVLGKPFGEPCHGPSNTSGGTEIPGAVGSRGLR